MPNTNAFTLEEINQILEQLNAHPGARLQYIGSRYVPKFADPYQWSNANTYEPLTIVTNEGNSFTSKQYVPAGIDISNDEYWIETGNYNAQIEQYRQEVLALQSNINNLENEIETHNKVVSTPEHYGALGDGVTDDSASFQNAVNNSDILILTGKYKISDIDINKDVFIIGGTIKPIYDDANNSIFKGVFSASDCDLYLKNVSFVGDAYTPGDYVNEGSTTKSFVLCNNANLTMIGCSISRFRLNHRTATPSAITDRRGIAFSAFGKFKVLLEDCIFSDLSFEEFSQCENTIEANESVVEYRNCTFENFPYPSYSLVNCYGFVGFECHGCKINNVQYGGSAFNPAGIYANITENVIINSSFRNVFNAVGQVAEYLTVQDYFICANNKVYSGEKLCRSTCNKMIVFGNDFKGQQLCSLELDFDGGSTPVYGELSNDVSMEIENNTCKLENVETNKIARFSYIACIGTSSNHIREVLIKGNTIEKDFSISGAISLINCDMARILDCYLTAGTNILSSTNTQGSLIISNTDMTALLMNNFIKYATDGSITSNVLASVIGESTIDEFNDVVSYPVAYTEPTRKNGNGNYSFIQS